MGLSPKCSTAEGDISSSTRAQQRKNADDTSQLERMAFNRFSIAFPLQSRLSFRRDAHASSVEDDKGALQPSRGRTAPRALTGQFVSVELVADVPAFCDVNISALPAVIHSAALHSGLARSVSKAGRLDLWTIQTSQRKGLNCPLAIHSQHADLNLQQGTHPAAHTWRVLALPSSRRVIGGIPSRLRIARRSGWSTSSMTTLSLPSCGAQAACLPALRPCDSSLHPAHARRSAAGRRHAAGLIRLTLHGNPKPDN